jgi:hypothetical protein
MSLVAPVIFNVAVVALEYTPPLVILAQLFPMSVLICHWKLVADADVMLNAALLPGLSNCNEGCAVMAGPAPGLMVKAMF